MNINITLYQIEKECVSYENPNHSMRNIGYNYTKNIYIYKNDIYYRNEEINLKKTKTKNDINI